MEQLSQTQKEEAIRRIIASPEWEHIAAMMRDLIEELIHVTSVNGERSAEEIAVDVKGRKYAVALLDKLLKSLGAYENEHGAIGLKRTFR